MNKHSGFRVQCQCSVCTCRVVAISKLPSRRVQLEVELMNKYRRLRVLLEVLLKRIVYSR